VLLHHHDIQDFLQVCLCIHSDSSLIPVQGDEEELMRLLAGRVEVDENGGKSHSRSCMVNTKFSRLTVGELVSAAEAKPLKLTWSDSAIIVSTRTPFSAFCFRKLCAAL